MYELWGGGGAPFKKNNDGTLSDRAGLISKQEVVMLVAPCSLVDGREILLILFCGKTGSISVYAAFLKLLYAHFLIFSEFGFNEQTILCGKLLSMKILLR